jgi:starvation-inducible DNA-binding protein
MRNNIGITDAAAQEVAKLLTKLLADEFVLYTKTRNAHWNVEGHDFHTVHLFFESQYQQLEEIVDSVAERIRTLGHYAVGTLHGMLELTHLTETSRAKNDSSGFIHELLEDHSSIVEYIRMNIKLTADKYDDFGTSDFITGLIKTHEKLTWMLAAHLSMVKAIRH